MTEPTDIPPPPETEEISQVDQLNQELKECKDKYLRQLAETENMRKRLQKEKQEMTQYAMGNIMTEFLNPIDHMEIALKHTENSSDDVKHWALGFKMILTQFKDVLTMNGVLPIDAIGKPFDHNIHEAIEMIETDKFPPGTVVEELVRGFKLGDKVIRPARVKVAKAVSQAEKN